MEAGDCGLWCQRRARQRYKDQKRKCNADPDKVTQTLDRISQKTICIQTEQSEKVGIKLKTSVPIKNPLLIYGEEIVEGGPLKPMSPLPFWCSSLI